MLTTLMTITSGSARVAGVDVTADPDAARNKIGVALQEAGLDIRQTGRELVILQGRLYGLSQAERPSGRTTFSSWSTSRTTRTAGSRGTQEG